MTSLALSGPYRATSRPEAPTGVELVLSWSDDVIDVAHVEASSATDADLSKWPEVAVGKGIALAREVDGDVLRAELDDGLTIVARPSLGVTTRPPRRWLEGSVPLWALLVALVHAALLSTAPPARVGLRVEGLESSALARHLAGGDDEWVMLPPVHVEIDPRSLPCGACPTTRVVCYAPASPPTWFDPDPFAAVHWPHGELRGPAAGVSAAAATGSLSAVTVRRVAQRHRPEIGVCFEGAGAALSVGGEIEVSLAIAETGRVTRAEIADAEVERFGAPVASCIERAVARWAFPMAIDGTIAQLSFRRVAPAR